MKQQTIFDAIFGTFKASLEPEYPNSSLALFHFYRPLGGGTAVQMVTNCKMETAIELIEAWIKGQTE